MERRRRAEAERGLELLRDQSHFDADALLDALQVLGTVGSLAEHLGRDRGGDRRAELARLAGKLGQDGETFLHDLLAQRAVGALLPGDAERARHLHAVTHLEDALSLDVDVGDLALRGA
eukprot:3612305-Prymnesium_polylepis.1